MKTVLQRLLRFTGVTCGLAGLFALPAQAQITLSLSPSAQSIYVGDTAYVDLQISGLGSTKLGGWYVEIDYLTSILGTPAVAFASPFSPGVFGSGVNPSPFYFYADGTADSGALNLPTGAGPITLATFSFVGLTPGTSPVSWAIDQDSINWNSLSDDVGASLTFVNDDPVEITVRARPSNGVPDTPVTLPLIAVIGLLLAFRRHGRRAA